MSEFIAYYESSVGTYMPVIALYRSDGSHEFKDMKKSDLDRLPDTVSEDGRILGGWIHRNAGKVGLRDNWQRRFAIIKGPYIFYFQSQKSETPVGVIPLENCEVYTPGGGVRSFNNNQLVRGGKEGGYEFEIRHTTRNNFHLSAMNEDERDAWVDMIQDRTGQVNGVAVKNSHKQLAPSYKSGPSMQNISVTRSRLEISADDTIYNDGASSSKGMYDEDDYSGVSDGIFAPPPPPTSQQYTSQHGSLFESGADQNSADEVYYGEAYGGQEQLHIQQHHQEQRQETPQNLDDALAHSRQRDEEIKELAKAERQQLQRDLAHKIMFQQEGRKREAEARERSHNKNRIELARIQEAKNPLTLAVMFRYLLSFTNEELCEEADPDSPLQFPHLKGHWAENMLSSIYRRYCKTTGFMSLEEFVEFMEDTAVLRTHVPHDELDEPLREFQSQLDPVVLLSTVPRNLGYSDAVEEIEHATKSSVVGDNFRLNFAQFYQILLRITNIVYPDLYATAPPHAFNKFLQESILPLSCWAKGHHKRGSTDTLVTDERIVLLLMTYAPNLWRVFLSYAQDCRAKVPSISTSPYPETAKKSERYLFGPPPGAPSESITCDDVTGVFMTESSCLKFCQDYGLMPHLMNRTIMKDIVFSLNRPKTVSNRPKPKSAQAPTVFFQKTQASLIREQIGNSYKAQIYTRPMHFNDTSPRRTSRARNLPLHLSNPTFTLEETGGLGFSEFIELIARIALEGMEAENYNVLFPTPFSKILGLLSVWGVADLKKLEEVRLLNSVE